MIDVRRFDPQPLPEPYSSEPAELEECGDGDYVLFEDYKILDERFRAMIKASNQNYSDACDLQEELEKLKKEKDLGTRLAAAQPDLPSSYR